MKVIILLYFVMLTCDMIDLLVAGLTWCVYSELLTSVLREPSVGKYQ